MPRAAPVRPFERLLVVPGSKSRGFEDTLGLRAGRILNLWAAEKAVIVAGVAGSIVVTIFLAVVGVRRIKRRVDRLQEAILKGVGQRLDGRLENLFWQLEALQGLSTELALTRSLPPTGYWAATPDFLREIALHALRFRPTRIVECGSGVSTLVLGRCVQLNGEGHVYSLEDSPDWARKTREHLERHGCDGLATVLDAPLRALRLKGEEWPWYSLEKLPEGGIDMLVIDGPPGHLRARARYPAGPLLFARLTPGAAVFLDDAERPDEKAALLEWQREYPNLRPETRRSERGCLVLWNDPAIALEEGVRAPEIPRTPEAPC